MKITRRQLQKIISEAMFSPRAARQSAGERTQKTVSPHLTRTGRGKIKTNLRTMSPKQLQNLQTLIDAEDEETSTLGKSYRDTIGNYSSPRSHKGYTSEDDIKDFDQAMDDVTLKYRRMQALEDWEKYMSTLSPDLRSLANKLTRPGIDLYVASHPDDYRMDAVPAAEVIRNPEDFLVMGISSHDSDFNFSNELGEILSIGFGGDDMDAMLVFLETLVGGARIDHIPVGFTFSPEHAFIFWITENNPDLTIYVDP